MKSMFARRHLIIGAGNLGMDLFYEFRRLGDDITILSRSNGFDVLDVNALSKALQPKYDFIWYCVGAGSVKEAKENPTLARAIHFTTPSLIAKLAHADTRISVFSTDYVADPNRPTDPYKQTAEPQSKYAEMKLTMENHFMALDRPQTAVIRVGSLFGVHKPDQTFPGKILANFGFSDLRICLPNNIVTPTPTMWIAGVISQHLEHLFYDHGVKFHHVAPRGNVSVHDWAVLILKGLRKWNDFKRDKDFYDDERPLYSGLGCTLIDPCKLPHWHDVWKAYYNGRIYTPKRFLNLLPLDIAFSDMPGTAASS